MKQFSPNFSAYFIFSFISVRSDYQILKNLLSRFPIFNFTNSAIFVIKHFLFACIAEGIVGPLISFSILPLASNKTLITSYDDYAQLCGANDCSESSSSNPNLEKPNSTLVCVLLLFAKTTSTDLDL